jgi:hypothetical protein
MSDDEILAGLREIDRANSTPLHDAVDRIGTHGDGFELDARRGADGTVEATAEGTKTLGGGWTIAAGVAYAQRQWYALGKLIWSPK